jgi:four helix bundle protein
MRLAMSSKPWDLCERTFLFACDIVRFCRELAKEPGAPRQIAAQLLDAGTSIGANTEEARGAYSRREFASKNSIVLRECRETRFWLRVILSTALASSEAVTPLLAEANELVGIFTATVRRSRLPLLTGSKLLVFLVVILFVTCVFNFSLLTFNF